MHAFSKDFIFKLSFQILDFPNLFHRFRVDGGENESISLRFQIKTHLCSRGFRLYTRCVCLSFTHSTNKPSEICAGLQIFRIARTLDKNL